MSLETMTKLQTVTVGAGGSATVSFTNIPQGYTDLKVVFSSRGTRASDFDGVYLSFNGSTSNFSGIYLQAITPSTPTSGSLGRYVGAFPATNLTNQVGSAELYISNYSGNTFKTYACDSVAGGNAGTNQTLLELISGIWSNPSPITSMSFAFLLGNFAQHSTVTLYGIKDARQTAGNSIKATGGNIVFDGTYVYHAFTSTGAFVPTQSLITDMLVVGGGGGGGGARAGSHYGGGGGAGAALTLASQYLTVGSYAVTVGSGGTGGNNSASYTQGTNGNSSQFAALTVATGGGGGGSGTKSGLAGASGGGGGGELSSTPAGGAGSQGFAGGAGGGTYRAGGGGGAGGVGFAGNPNATSGGPGGIGLTSTLINALCSATGVGQNVGGTWYVAGGGAGTPESAAGGFGGGGASMDPTFPIVRGFGTANTGGGGGGGTATSPAEAGGTGGSGVVIIRYKG